MTSPPVHAPAQALAAERDMLRRELRAQREVIAERLAPAPAASAGAFPRSRTVRFLTRRPATALRLLASAATLVFGARMVKMAGTAFVVAGLVRSITRREPGG